MVCGFGLPDLAERDGAWAEALGLLAVVPALGGGCAAARGLVGAGHFVDFWF